MRGEHGLRWHPLSLVFRFIPACAGNTAHGWRSPPASAVHPRVRGEHPPDPSNVPYRAGSSPRARGTRPTSVKPPGGKGSSPRARGTRHLGPDRSARTRCRFIPACAGNTSPWFPALPRYPVHPRVRGEHIRPVPSAQAPRVHPRVRGEHRIRNRTTYPRHRFIPACAGNTTHLPWRQSAFETVHPRVRGEHTSRRTTSQTSPGSSPRARGTLAVQPRNGQRDRFIPACAGNTVSPTPLTTGGITVHPRVRGEHPTSMRFRYPVHPRVRGEHVPPYTVHPRVRGEHPVSFEAAMLSIGSSPRARGTHAPGEPRARRRTVHPRVRGEHSFRKPLIAILFCHVKERTRLRRGNSWANWMVDERIVALTGVNSIADPHPTAGISQA